MNNSDELWLEHCLKEALKSKIFKYYTFTEINQSLKKCGIIDSYDNILHLIDNHKYVNGYKTMAKYIAQHYSSLIDQSPKIHPEIHKFYENNGHKIMQDVAYKTFYYGKTGIEYTLATYKYLPINYVHTEFGMVSEKKMLKLIKLASFL